MESFVFPDMAGGGSAPLAPPNLPLGCGRVKLFTQLGGVDLLLMALMIESNKSTHYYTVWLQIFVVKN